VRRILLVLALLLAWSFGLRVWLSTHDLTAHRFWDERYGIANIRALIVDRELRPANGFHPGFSYVPHAVLCAASEALHGLTGREIFAIFPASGDMTPTGYFLCRLLQALAGTLSIYLTYLIGRRLFSPGVGLLGALFLAIVPWHLRQSVIFKPDIFLVATSLFAFDRSLVAAARPNRGRFLQAGGAIGLALASKLNGGPIAFPLMVATLTDGGWRDRKRWGWLILAGLAAVAVFLVFTPFLVLDPALYFKDFGRTLRDYERKGVRRGGSHFHVLAEGLKSLLEGGFHGPVIGCLGLLGFALLTLWALRKRRQGERMEWLGPAMMGSYVLGYALLYTLSTLNPSEHNWLPIVPFTSLGAAWLLVRSYAWLTDRVPLLRHRAIAVATGVALAAGAVLLAVPPTLFTYRGVVPTTRELAGKLLAERLQPLQGRIILSERDKDPAPLIAGRTRAIVQNAERLSRWAPVELDLADAVVVPAARLKGEDSELYRARVSSRGGETVRIPPQLLRVRGPELLVLLHPWRPAGRPVRIPVETLGPRRARLAGRLADVRPGEVLSLEIVLPSKWKSDALRQVLIQEQPVFARSAGLERKRRRILTHRFVAAAPNPEIVLVLKRPLAPRLDVKVRFRRWQR
jgi:hypothetical protein